MGLDFINDKEVNVKRHMVSVEDVDKEYTFVQCSSSRDRKRLEQKIRPFEGGKSIFVLYTRLGGQPEREEMYSTLKKALEEYNKIGKHEAGIQLLNAPMELVIAASFEDRQKQLSFRFNAVEESLVWRVTWKNPGKEKSNRVINNAEEAINTYNAI